MPSSLCLSLGRPSEYSGKAATKTCERAGPHPSLQMYRRQRMDREEFMLNKGRGFEQNTQKISRSISSKSIVLVPKYVHVAWEIKEEILYEHNFHFANLDEEIRFVNFFAIDHLPDSRILLSLSRSRQSVLLPKEAPTYQNR